MAVMQENFDSNPTTTPASLHANTNVNQLIRNDNNNIVDLNTETKHDTQPVQLVNKIDSVSVAEQDRLKQLVNMDSVVVFIKGKPWDTRCNFSAQIVKLLCENNIKFEYYDILTDKDARDNLKVIYNWPTYPQVYVDGELIGGLDVVREMIREGDLRKLLDERAPHAISCVRFHNTNNSSRFCEKNYTSLKIRLPDNTIMEAEFKVTDTIESVYSYLMNTVSFEVEDSCNTCKDTKKYKKKPFTLMTPVPKTYFDQSKLNSKLKDLGLYPDGILIVALTDTDSIGEAMQSRCSENKECGDSYVSHVVAKQPAIFYTLLTTALATTTLLAFRFLKKN